MYQSIAHLNQAALSSKPGKSPLKYFGSNMGSGKSTSGPRIFEWRPRTSCGILWCSRTCVSSSTLDVARSKWGRIRHATHKNRIPTKHVLFLIRVYLRNRLGFVGVNWAPARIKITPGQNQFRDILWLVHVIMTWRVFLKIERFLWCLLFPFRSSKSLTWIRIRFGIPAVYA